MRQVVWSASWKSSNRRIFSYDFVTKDKEAAALLRRWWVFHVIRKHPSLNMYFEPRDIDQLLRKHDMFIDPIYDPPQVERRTWAVKWRPFWGPPRNNVYALVNLSSMVTHKPIGINEKLNAYDFGFLSKRKPWKVITRQHAEYVIRDMGGKIED